MGGSKDLEDLKRLTANGTENNITGPEKNGGNNWNLDQK